ncbi:MAG: SpoIIE family protein phosphatase [Clostridiales Family XIII bacterium]|jgi:sigma-B regulation protein RsbU (phosphoserine phosphatase)|nr:SpoIIE family protein phosphatase [Clostridiales Family XIII bacterium]
MKDKNYKNSIYAKVRGKMLAASLLSAVVIFVVAAAAIFIIRISVADMSKELGDQATNYSTAGMTEVTHESLQSVATNRAMLSDAKLQTVSMAVNMISAKATEIMSHPDRYIGREVLPPDPKNDGTIVAQVSYAEGSNPSALSHELGLLGNLQDIQISSLKTENTIASMQIGSETGIMIMVDDMSGTKTSPYDPRVRPWYVEAKKENTLIWTDVFDDSFGRGLSITCGMPYYNEAGQIQGVVSAGMLLATLNETVIDARIGDGGKTFIVNENGEVLISEDIAKDKDGNIVKENLLKSDSETMRAAAENMTKGESGIESVTLDGKNYFISYAPLTVRPWSFAVLVKEDEVLSHATAMTKQISKFTDETLTKIEWIFLITLGAFAFLLLVIALIEIRHSRSVASKITAPIISLTDNVRAFVSDEHQEIDFHIDTGDEIEELADSFADMKVRLNDYIKNLTVVTAKDERISTELNVAKSIQDSMLPCVFPPYPDRTEFALYANMQSAKEVGGDFYDFFLIDNNTLCVVIADVSGKGVPGAMFMAISKTLIKSNAQSGLLPSEVFGIVNNMLYENNEAEMFVTAFMGYLDIPTGKFSFVNAGHNPPIVKQGDHFRQLAIEPGFVLASFPNVRYTEDSLMLRAGDMLCMYTDGVTEATNSAKEFYSLQRLIRVANAQNTSDPETFTKGIKESIDLFVGDEERADDITVLTLNYAGADMNVAYDVPTCIRRELEVAAEMKNLERVLDFITAPLRERGINEGFISQVELAVEEVFVNIVHYAYAPRRGSAKIKLFCGENMTLIFEDGGAPFNPLSAVEPDIDLPINRRKIGGLGIFMTKKIMDSVMYRYEDGKNVLTISKKPPGVS